MMRARFVPFAAFVLAAFAAAMAAEAQTCPGDCNGNGNVSSPELARAARIALAEVGLDDCTAADADGDLVVDVVDLVIGVNEHLTSCSFATPTPTQVPSLPDLVPDRATFRGVPSGTCPLAENSARVEVCIRNLSPAAAPAFEALVYGSVRVSFPDLSSGSGACVLTDYLGAEVSLLVDPDNVIAESNEANNAEIFDVPGETPGPTCTATVTRTPTETRTPLPPGSPSSTPAATDTPTATPEVSQTPTRSATLTPTCACTFTATAAPHSPTPTATPTATRTPGLPDLIPNRVVVIAPTPIAGCVNSFDEIDLSLEVCVLNDGTGDAAPFESMVRVSSSIAVPFTAGVPADAEVCSAAPFIEGQLIFEVDTSGEIAEMSESNNVEVFIIQRPTPPPLCPTRTPTPG